MKNKQKDDEHKPKSVKHEDKIANLLKNMKERKGRRRISIDERLKKMEKLVKKKEKVANKTEMNSTKSSKNKDISNIEIRAKRKTVPTSKILSFKESRKRKESVEQNNIQESRKQSSTKLEKKEKQLNRKEEQSTRARNPTSKFLVFQNSMKKKSKSNKAELKEKSSKLSNIEKSEPIIAAQSKVTTSNQHDTLNLKKIANNEKSGSKNGSNKNTSPERPLKLQLELKNPKRERILTSKFNDFKESLKSKQESERPKSESLSKAVVVGLPKNLTEQGKSTSFKQGLKKKCEEVSSPVKSFSNNQPIQYSKRERILTSKLKDFKDSLKHDKEVIKAKSQNCSMESPVKSLSKKTSSVQLLQQKNKRERIPTSRFKDFKESLKQDQEEIKTKSLETSVTSKNEKLKKQFSPVKNVQGPSTPVTKVSRERVKTSKFLSYQESLKADETTAGKAASSTEKPKTNTPIESQQKSSVKVPSKTLPVPAATPSVEYNSRKQFMDALLKNHYSSPTIQTSSMNNTQSDANLISKSNNNEAPPISETDSESDDDYFYVEVDEDISFKSPRKDKDKGMPNNRNKSSNLNRKVTMEMSKYKKIAPKSSVGLKAIQALHGKVNPMFIPCHKSDHISWSLNEYLAHCRKVNIKPMSEFLKFPAFLGFNCSLLGSKYHSVNYYVTEVVPPKKTTLFQMPENLSETCLFFIPHVILANFEDLKQASNILIPYYCHNKGFAAYFPNSSNPLQVSWATNMTSAEQCVNNRQMFILTKSRFKLIQSVRGGKENNRSFCKMIDESQLHIENFVRMQTESMLQTYNSTAQEVTPQVSLDVYKCPFKGCDFVSDRRYSGIRNHSLKHFKNRIELEAKPRAFLTERDKSNCMSTTGCSVSILTGRGELVHHFGIFHCLVDDLFEEYASKWLKENFSNYIMKKQCPYEDYHFTDEADFLNHLTTAHYFNGILSEVEDMVKFSLSFFEEYKCMANLYKCPFCKKKFKNLATGSNVRDVKEMVIHCGMEHGFALYYLMSDERMEEMKMILKSLQIKQEPVEQNNESTNIIDPSFIKLEPIEEDDTDINNFLQLDIQD